MNFSGIFILVFVLLPMLLGGLLVYLKLMPKRKKEKGFEFVYVEKDETVRELNHNEIEYLNRSFYPGDMGRPYIKKTFGERDSKGNISGFILRTRVPKSIVIQKKGSGPVNLN